MNSHCIRIHQKRRFYDKNSTMFNPNTFDAFGLQNQNKNHIYISDMQHIYKVAITPTVQNKLTIH